MATDLEAATQAAWAAHDRGDWPDAIRHWQTCIGLDPAMSAAYWMGGTLLLRAGRLDEAEAMLSEGVRRDPLNARMAVEYAKVATAVQNWPVAIRRWNTVAKLAPGLPEVIEGRSDFAMQLRSHQIDGSIGDTAADIDWGSFGSTEKTATDTELLMQFESLGDNCEFGFVQRHFGAEPLSLLRWTSIGIGTLIRCIEEEFGAIGDPAHCELKVELADELILHDHRHGMRMHTFLRAAHIPIGERAALHGKMCRRLSFLGNKLMQDLRNPVKTFVLKARDGVPLQEVRRLHQVMQRHAPNRLLHVVEASAERPPGVVREISPMLYVGAIERFVHEGQGWGTVDVDGWHEICRGVQEFSRSAAPPLGLVSDFSALPPPPPPNPPAVAAAPLPASVPPLPATAPPMPATTPPLPPAARAQAAKRPSGTAWDALTRPDAPALPPSPAPRGLFSRVLGRLGGR